MYGSDSTKILLQSHESYPMNRKSKKKHSQSRQIAYTLALQSFCAGSMSKQQTRFGRSSLPDLVESEILLYFTSPSRPKFSHYAEQRQHIFGTGSSSGTAKQRSLRNKVRNRVSYLASRPDILKIALEAKGFEVPSYIQEQAAYLVKSPDNLSALGSPIGARNLFESFENPQGTEPSPTPPSKTSGECTLLLLSSSKHRHSLFIECLLAATMDRSIDTSSENEGLVFEADLKDPRKNPEGMFIVHTPSARVSDTLVVGRLTIYVPIHDIRDFQAGRFKASLTEEGDRIVFRVPSIPYFMWKVVRKEGMDDSYAVLQQEDLRSGSICQNTVASVAAAATKIEGLDNLLLKVVTLTMPQIHRENVTLNNEHFNKGQEGTMNLTGRLRRAGSTVKGQTQTHAFVWYSVAIDGTDQKLRNVKVNSEEEELAKALNSTLFIDDE
jgi:hypothetical protein